MKAASNKRSTETSFSLHPRNPHQGRYDLEALSLSTPELKPFLTTNPRAELTINFSDENAVLCLNRALLKHFYKVTHWQLPKGYLCPPIPGRADYIHYLADLLTTTRNSDQPPHDSSVKVLDIGTGANCIYPIIGSQSYGWQFTASDIDPVSVRTARLIVDSNPCLKGRINIKQQDDSSKLFTGIIQPDDRYDLTLCNPPFHGSPKEAQAGTQRKWRNLNKHKTETTQSSTLNFGGQKAELWCEGGEIRFLKQMINESVRFAHQVCWFTSLVSKGDNIQPLKRLLKQKGALHIKVIKMAQGQKTSRFIAWSFLTHFPKRSDLCSTSKQLYTHSP
ncbi:23S rRNA (adenine(1618)-N(6))-methyltransferase [Endozoicomonas sp. (ex Bugula neritina AB1)]|nr:23S rRNA (adenine(1618)-N(6))-methyltransferase [Endozoicomonas sp. (ex Bugula neritina AB1)]